MDDAVIGTKQLRQWLQRAWALEWAHLDQPQKPVCAYAPRSPGPAEREEGQGPVCGSTEVSSAMYPLQPGLLFFERPRNQQKPFQQP